MRFSKHSANIFSCAKQLIEDTIRRNASPVRSDAPQGGSCSSLASSTSDEAVPRANRNSMSVAGGQLINNFNSVPNQAATFIGGIGVNKTQRNSSGRQQLSHSLSTNDASLGEYKYTVGIGNHSIKITGDRFELVQVAYYSISFFFLAVINVSDKHFSDGKIGSGRLLQQ